MAEVTHKKVELVELFFDLVLVYAIAQTTGLIHHLHNGVLSPTAVLSFIIAYIVIINAWVYQTVFTNRYGANSPRDVAFSLINMALLLYLSNAIMADWEASFRPFTVSLGLIFCVQFMQYALVYTRDTTPDGRFLIRGFLLVTGIYAATLLIGAALPYYIGVFVTLGGLVINVTLPIAFTRRLNTIPLNFPHLLERYTLLVIITFGEMVVGIAPWFTPATISAESVLVFGVLAVLFCHYVLMFDRMVNEHSDGSGTFRLQYAHVPIFLGLGMITVSLAFLGEAEANLQFTAVFMFVGLALVYGGMALCSRYLQPRFCPTLRFAALQGAFFVAGFALALACSFSATTLSCAFCATCAAEFILAARWYNKRKTLAK